MNMHVRFSCVHSYFALQMSPALLDYYAIVAQFYSYLSHFHRELGNHKMIFSVMLALHIHNCGYSNRII